jgi:hypothetical protein
LDVHAKTTFETGVRSLLNMLTRWMRAAAIRNREAIATFVLSATAGAVAVARTIFNERLSDDLRKSAREGTGATRIE